MIRISEQVRLSAEVVEEEEIEQEAEQAALVERNGGYQKLTTSKLARALGMTTADFTDHLVACGYLELKGETLYITSAGKNAGGEFRKSPKFGPYFLWPHDLQV